MINSFWSDTEKDEDNIFASDYDSDHQRINNRLEEKIENLIKQEFDEFSLGEESSDDEDQDSFVTSSIGQKLIDTCIEPKTLCGIIKNDLSSGYMQTRPLLHLTKNASNCSEIVILSDENKKLQILNDSLSKQLDFSNNSLESLKDKLSKSERSMRHTLNLKQIEIDALNTKFNDIKEKCSSLNELIVQTNSQLLEKDQQLDCLKGENEKLTEQIRSIEASNASLTNQLAEISRGQTLKRVSDLENKFEETLARRRAIDHEEFEEKYAIIKRKLDSKDAEFEQVKTDLKRLELEKDELRSRLKSERTKFQLEIEELERINFETTPGCLRERLKDAETKNREAESSLKISLEANSILQFELHDLRKQLTVYERALGLFQEIENSKKKTNLHSTPYNNPKRSELNADWSSIQRTYEENGNLQKSHEEDDTQIQEEDQILLTDELKTLNHDLGKKVPSNLSNSPKENLQLSINESRIKEITVWYKSKCDQLTTLREQMFNLIKDHEVDGQETKQLTAENLRLKHQVDSLSSELEQFKEFSSRPTARELTLEAQIQRLKQDFESQEADLILVRNRLQDSINNELKINERNINLQSQISSIQSNEARLEATCQDKLKSLEEKLKSDWNCERKRLVLEHEEIITVLRNDLVKLREILDKANKEKSEAVEIALKEALIEAERERDQIWRIEFPAQLERLKFNWSINAEKKTQVLINQAVEKERVNFFSNELPSKIAEIRANLIKEFEDERQKHINEAIIKEKLNWESDHLEKLAFVTKKNLKKCSEENHDVTFEEELENFLKENHFFSQDQLFELKKDLTETNLKNLSNLCRNIFKEFGFVNIVPFESASFFSYLETFLTGIVDDISRYRQDNENLSNLIKKQIPNYISNCQKHCIEIMTYRLNSVYSEAIGNFENMLLTGLKINSIQLNDIPDQTKSLVKMIIGIKEKLMCTILQMEVDAQRKFVDQETFSSSPTLKNSFTTNKLTENIPEPAPRRMQREPSASTSGCSSTGHVTPREILLPQITLIDDCQAREEDSSQPNDSTLSSHGILAKFFNEFQTDALS